MSSEKQQPASSILLAKLYCKETIDKSDNAKWLHCHWLYEPNQASKIKGVKTLYIP